MRAESGRRVRVRGRRRRSHFRGAGTKLYPAGKGVIPDGRTVICRAAGFCFPAAAKRALKKREIRWYRVLHVLIRDAGFFIFRRMKLL